MNEKSTVSAKQLCILLFLALSVEMAVRSFAVSGMPPAQKAIPAAILNAVLACLLLILPLRLQRGGTGEAWRGNAAGTKLLSFFSALLLAAGGAAAAIRAEEFFRYGCDEPLPHLLVYTVFLLAVFYALRCGMESLVRAVGIAAGIFLASMLLMLISNLGGMRLFNLAAEPFDLAGILQTATQGFTLPPELLLFFLLRPHVDSAEQVPVYRTVAALCLFYIALSFCAQAVLGPSAETQTQTIHTLSRLGSLSVFRRLDALHTAAWMLAELCKLSALACGVQSAVSRCLPKTLRMYSDRYAVGLIALLIVVCTGLSQPALSRVLTAGTAVLLAAMTIYGYFREGAYAKKRG